MVKQMSKLDYINNILDPHFKTDTLTRLKEDQANMEVELINDGQRFICFTFDKTLLKREYPKGLFPFFNRGEVGVTKICDYIIFTEQAGTLFILLIELKKGNDNVTKQLKAGKCFAEFIISTLNRVYLQKIIPEIRQISVREIKIRPKQKQKPIEYDDDNFHTFCNSKFRIKSYLK